MPLYSFSLRNGHRRDDFEAIEFLPDDAAAREEAHQIIHDLKKNNLTAWNGWRVAVTDGDRQVWQIAFIARDDAA
jgi:predicted N-acetyltransferase YhbS